MDYAREQDFERLNEIAKEKYQYTIKTLTEQVEILETIMKNKEKYVRKYTGKKLFGRFINEIEEDLKEFNENNYIVFNKDWFDTRQFRIEPILEYLMVSKSNVCIDEMFIGEFIDVEGFLGEVESRITRVKYYLGESKYLLDDWDNFVEEFKEMFDVVDNFNKKYKDYKNVCEFGKFIWLSSGIFNL